MEMNNVAILIFDIIIFINVYKILYTRIYRRVGNRIHVPNTDPLK